MMTDDGVWYDERVVSIPTGDAMKDAVYNMNRAAEQYTLPQRFTLNGETAPSTTHTTGAARMISDEAVEAAARALYKGQPIYDEEAGVITGHKPWEWMEPAYQEAMLSEARAALEAAAPHIIREAKAAAWDVGYMVGREDESSIHVPFMAHTHTRNPYRDQQ